MYTLSHTHVHAPSREVSTAKDASVVAAASSKPVLLVVGSASDGILTAAASSPGSAPRLSATPSARAWAGREVSTCICTCICACTCACTHTCIRTCQSVGQRRATRKELSPQARPAALACTVAVAITIAHRLCPDRLLSGANPTAGHTIGNQPGTHLIEGCGASRNTGLGRWKRQGGGDDAPPLNHPSCRSRWQQACELPSGASVTRAAPDRNMRRWHARHQASSVRGHQLVDREADER